MKTNRHRVILEIIESEAIQTQNQLMRALEVRGISATQATLSRDIRDLHLTKEPMPGGGYRYAAVHTGPDSDHIVRLRNIFLESVVSYDVAQNLFVIRTLPGLASAACSALDAIEVDDLVGSIAGDDTIFLAMKDNAAAERLYSEIRNLF